MNADNRATSVHRSRHLTPATLSIHQRGSTLIVSLIMLLLISLIGISSMEGTILQERMASNLQDRNIAFQASESALRVGEDWLKDNQITASTADRLTDPAGWEGSDGEVVDINEDQVSENPAYHVGYVGCSPKGGIELETFVCLDRFAVTARGQGGNENTAVVIQSIVMPKPD